MDASRQYGECDGAIRYQTVGRKQEDIGQEDVTVSPISLSSIRPTKRQY